MVQQPANLNEIPEWWRVFEPVPGKPGYVGLDGWCGMGNGTRAIIEAVLKKGGYLKYLAAVNHWPEAILVHTANYPGVAHFCSKMENLSPKLAVPFEFISMFTAGIKCTSHSRAAGGTPRKEQDRLDAYELLHWMMERYVQHLVVENVPEFERWGPLDANGHPIKRLEGTQFNGFINDLRAMNYKVEWKVLRACWFGDPTSRERLWIVAHKTTGRKIAFPTPTYRDPNAQPDMFNSRLPTWPVARDIIDWSLPMKSIFGSDLVPNSLSRILAGADRFAGGRLEFPALPGCPPLPAPKTPVIVKNGQRKRVARTSPYARSAWNLHYLNLSIRAARGLKLAVKNRKFVKRIAPEAVEIVRRALVVGQPNWQPDEQFAIKLYGTSASTSLDQALPSVTAQGNHLGLIMVNRGGNDGYERNTALIDPLPGLTTQNPINLIEFLAPRHGERPGAAPRTHAVDAAFPTLTGTNSPTLVQAMILGQQSESAARSADQEVPTVTTEGAIRLVTSVVLPNEGYFHGNQPRSVDQALPGLTTNGAGNLVSYLFGYEHRGETDERVQSTDQALRTVTGSGDWAVAAFLTRYNASGQRDRMASVDEALPTVDTSNRYAAAFLAVYYGTTEGKASSASEALRTVKTHDSFMLVVPTPLGDRLLDIRYRMLVRDELARAHSVSPDFKFGTIKDDDAKRMIGGSWPQKMGNAVVYAAWFGGQDGAE